MNSSRTLVSRNHRSVHGHPIATTLRVTALGILALTAIVGSRAATAVIDTSSTQQIIRGFGGATVFEPPGLPASLSGDELDTIFGNGPGQLGFTLLRIRVATDDAWRAVELGHALGAMARGAEVIATPWSPPAAMKDNYSLVAGSLNPSAYAGYARYLNEFAQYMAANGAPLYAISIQNEPDITVDYESCDWTAAQMLDFCRNHAGVITATRVIMPESFQFNHAQSDPTLNDSIAAANISIVGGHIYGGGLAPYPLAVAKGKEVWMTEHLDTATDWASVFATGKEIHDCLAVANFNAYIWWYLKRFYGPLGEDGVITKRGYVMAQYAKFIRPGYVRVAATENPAAGIHVSAYIGATAVIVAINTDGSDVSQTFSITSATVSSISSWVTSGTLDLAPQSALSASSGTFTATLPAQSITTFVGDLGLPGPTIVSSPSNLTVATGSTAAFAVSATGQFLLYQWNRNGTPIAGAINRWLSIPHAQAGDAASYDVTVSNSGGSITSASATLGVADTPDIGRLINLSARSSVGAADNVQIAGFVVTGSTPKPMLVRAAGPALFDVFQLPGTLADPVINLRNENTNTVIASNDDWDSALAPTFASVGAFGWTTGSKDAALLTTLAPGAYTTVVNGKDNGTGVALVEVYDADGGTPAPRLVNLSTRSFVGTDTNVLIAGFVIGGSTARTVVIRAAGPALIRSFGLGGVLADPAIEMHHSSDDRVLATNDDWESGLASDFAAVGAFSWTPGSRDAALIATLEPGGYTVVDRGKNDGTGVALVEVYDRP